MKTTKNYKIGENCKGLPSRVPPHGIDNKTHNDMIIQDGTFKFACEVAGIKPTKRQMSKWRQGRGLARSVVA